MKKITMLVVSACLITSVIRGETQDKNEKFRIGLTAEPLNFIFNGYSFWLGVKYKQFEIGLTTFSSYSSTHVLFEQDDRLDIKLQNGTAGYGRFYLLPHKKHNPFVGFLLGTETWRIRSANRQEGENLLKNEFFTPQVGYQFNLLKKRFVINPNVRFIVPFNTRGERSINNVPYELKNFGVIPAFDLGVCYYF